MANFNSNPDVDYKFENIKFENADIKMKAIFWDIIRKEQKALGEIDKKINTIKDEHLKQRLIKLSGTILDTIVKMYNSGDEISLLFQQLDQTLQELGEIEDENIAKIIASINYEPQEKTPKKPNKVSEDVAQNSQAIEDNLQETNKKEEQQNEEKQNAENEVQTPKNDEIEIEKSPAEEEKPSEEEIAPVEVEEQIDKPVPASKEETEIDIPKVTTEESEVKETKEAIESGLDKTEENETKEDKLNKDIQSLMADIKNITLKPTIESSEQKKEPEENSAEEPIVETPTIESQEEKTADLPAIADMVLPEISPVVTSESQPQVNSENENETDSLPEIVSVEDELTPQISASEEVQTENIENNTPAPVEQAVEPTTSDQETPQVEPVQAKETEEPLASLPDIKVLTQQDVVEQNNQEEKKPDFIKTTDSPAKAILTTRKQVTKLRNSRETQEALFTSNSIKNNSDLTSNFEQPAEYSQPTTEKMLAQVEKLYSEGKTEEAEKLMEEITAKGQSEQPQANIENYPSSTANTLQPTDNMLSIPSVSEPKQFTLAA